MNKSHQVDEIGSDAKLQKKMSESSWVSGNAREE